MNPKRYSDKELKKVWMNLGSLGERSATLSYLQDVLHNIRRVDSVPLTIESVLTTIILEIDEEVHHEAGARL
jgi:hypothetical protein